MRRFACRNFQIADTIDSKLSYTPCYNYVILEKHRIYLEHPIVVPSVEYTRDYISSDEIQRYVDF